MSEALAPVANPDPLQRELAETRKRLAELKRRAKAEQQATERAGKTRSTIENPEASDWVWGARLLGLLLNRSQSQIYYLRSRLFWRRGLENEPQKLGWLARQAGRACRQARRRQITNPLRTAVPVAVSAPAAVHSIPDSDAARRSEPAKV